MKERAQFVLFIHMQCTACLPDLHFPPILFARMQCSYSSPASSADKNQNKACQAVDQESKISSSRSQQAVRTRSHCTQPATTLGCEGGQKLAHVPCSCRADRVGPLLQLEQLHTDPSIVFVRACTGPHSPAARLYTSFSLESDASRARTAQQLEKQLYVVATASKFRY